MDVLNLLKFWKTSTVHGEGTTINASKTQIHQSTDESQSENDVDDDEEEDSFFELEIRVPDYDNEKNRDTQEKDNKNGGNFNIAESNLSRFKGRRILPIEPNTKPQSPISILKSAPKFRVFMTSFNSTKTRKPEKTEQTEKRKKNRVSSTETPKHSQQESKRFTVSLNVDDEEGDEEEGIPVYSLFARANSSRTSKLQKQSSTDDSKRFSKDVVQKYLKLIKPFYVKVSKRYGENRVKLSDLLYTASPTSSPTPAPAISSPKNNLSGFRVLGKHLGKSRSASSAVGVVSSSPVVSRRDDSLLLQDDGIQSAILHCKRSFNSSRESSHLSRCTSDSSHEKLTEPWRRSTEEESSDGVSM